jgi:hypothetical protein
VVDDLFGWILQSTSATVVLYFCLVMLPFQQVGLIIMIENWESCIISLPAVLCCMLGLNIVIKDWYLGFFCILCISNKSFSNLALALLTLA